MRELYKPDFTNSNINISSTLAEYLGAPARNATLPVLKAQLAKDYRKVVFVCFDGMGIHPLEQNLPQSDFLRKHIVQTLLAPFPATTTNATTSLITNRLPREHGWFGWSVNFPQMDRNINVFLNTDSWTGQPVEITASPLKKFPHYFDEANTDRQIVTVLPPYVETAHPQRNLVFRTTDEFFAHLDAVCSSEKRLFAYCYCPEPDHSMHVNGVVCSATKQQLLHISAQMQRLATTHPDVLFVVTADHGMVDVGEPVPLYTDQKLMGMLQIYPYMEPRAVAFKVRPGMKQQFEQYFNATYGDDFVLFDAAKLVADGYFGEVGDREFLLGDFVASGTYTHKQAALTPEAMIFAAHHTGLTEEMLVPLILIGDK